MRHRSANAVSATQGTGVFRSTTPTAAVGLGGNVTTSGAERTVSVKRFGAMMMVGWGLLYAQM